MDAKALIGGGFILAATLGGIGLTSLLFRYDHARAMKELYAELIEDKYALRHSARR